MTPRLSPGAQLALMPNRSAPVRRQLAGDGRVEIVPSPDGTLRLVARTIDQKWVAEHLCLVEDVDDKLIRAMELRAKKHEHLAIAIVK